MLLFQAHFHLEVWVVTKQCPPMSNNAGIISSVSPLHLFLWHSKSPIQAAQGVLHFQSDILSRSEWIAFRVTLECVLVCFSCASHQPRVTAIRTALYWCVHTCVACVPSHWGPVHMWGARPHQVCRWKEQHAIYVGKAKIVMNTLFHGCLSRSELWLVARKQTLGFNEAEQLLVCFGGTEWGGKEKGWSCERAVRKGRVGDLQRTEEGHLFPGTSSL